MTPDKIEIKSNYPPNYAQMEAVFGDLKKHNPVFAYAPYIYNPFDRKMTPDVIYHEKIHIDRQGTLPEIWYNYYIADREFRLNEEVIAYAEQFEFAKKHGVKGKMLDWLKEKLALELSGGGYGYLCSYGEAESKIRNYLKYGKQ